MKKYFIYCCAALLVAAIFLPGCTKLDSKVYNQVTPKNFFQTPAQVNAALAPAYSPMTALPCGNLFQCNEVTADELIIPTRGNDWYDGGQHQQLWLHTFTYTNPNVSGAWSEISRGVAQCNFVLNILNTLPAASKPANFPQIAAEIKVMRAYYYLKFMDLFGSVPLVTDFNTDPNKTVQSTRAQVYTFLESELKTNVPLLQLNTTAEYGHMTKYGGYMVLAHLYLNAQVYTGMAQWANAAAVADTVIKSGNYSLQPNFLDNFIVQNEGSVENIFVVPFNYLYIGGMEMIVNSLNYNNIATYNLTGQPYNGWCSPTPFYRSFTSDDARTKMWAVGQQYSASGEPLTDKATGLKVSFSPYVLQLSNPADSFKFAGARSIKYAPQPDTYTDASNSGVIYRLGDAYLIAAEANLRLGNAPSALTLVNALRARSGVAAWSLADLTLPNLLAERGRELAWEGFRREDLIRFEVADGIPYFTGARLPDKPQDPDKHTFILPIPQSQLNTNPKLIQNPGY